jgi:lysophospholipase L1-like esterase
MMRMRPIAVALSLLIASLLAAGTALPVERKSERRTPVIVAIGDSITAGFANATLVEETQRLSYPALIAAQMRVPFGQPLINKPGLPATGFHFDRAKHMLEIPYLSLQPARRLDPSNDLVHNFAVPNARLWEILTLQEKPGNELDALFQVILQGEGTQIEQARRKQPELVLVWVGNNDVLHVIARPPDDRNSTVLERLESRMTPVDDFRTAYRALLDRLTEPYKGGARNGKVPDLMVANIPDINDLPVLVPLGKKPGEACAIPFTIQTNSLLGLAAFPKDGEKLLTAEKLAGVELSLRKLGRKDMHPPGSKVSLLSVFDKDLNGRHALFTAIRERQRCFTDAQVLDPGQLHRIQKRIEEYNAIIGDLCAAKNIPVLDIHALFKNATANGILIGTMKLTTAYTGGLFSLDAIHPTHTGNAILANEFLKLLNTEIRQRGTFGGFHESIRLIDVESVLRDDPQRPHNRLSD